MLSEVKFKLRFVHDRHLAKAAANLYLYFVFRLLTLCEILVSMPLPKSEETTQLKVSAVSLRNPFLNSFIYLSFSSF